MFFAPPEAVPDHRHVHVPPCRPNRAPNTSLYDPQWITDGKLLIEKSQAIDA